MTTQEVLDYYGGLKRLSAELDIYPQAVLRWGPYPPELRQYQIQVFTNNKLLAEGQSNGTTANS